jgi:hypothetical protein
MTTQNITVQILRYDTTTGKHISLEMRSCATCHYNMACTDGIDRCGQTGSENHESCDDYDLRGWKPKNINVYSEMC